MRYRSHVAWHAIGRRQPTQRRVNGGKNILRFGDLRPLRVGKTVEPGDARRSRRTHRKHIITPSIFVTTDDMRDEICSRDRFDIVIADFANANKIPVQPDVPGRRARRKFRCQFSRTLRTISRAAAGRGALHASEPAALASLPDGAEFERIFASWLAARCAAHMIGTGLRRLRLVQCRRAKLDLADRPSRKRRLRSEPGSSGSRMTRASFDAAKGHCG